ncbi:hypothetical protein MUY27_11735 [Mucilaginibacter sp. RS28]|uniref:Uncharacterized protein n=1 Tax=Mucilaginibacter straminoryzae TaxID=2932774 RepID=A0A9X1X4H2_9SPHI|nr:hypothetical protein [Mucilaginibacter straminoryzae]MCJ8210381.1 hypothetical protein [Mucilaginibacter straminoryzae]
MSSIQEANSEKHYIFLAVAIFLGLVGVYLRFAGDEPYWSWAANVILVIAIIIALYKSVFKMLQ